MKLLQSKLTDDELLDAFYDKVIENYGYPENYFIILVHDAYDIPKITTDGIENFDASEYVYDYILCSICPVKLTKPGLLLQCRDQPHPRPDSRLARTAAGTWLFVPGI